VIGTRKSKLAMWQATHVRDKLSLVVPERTALLIEGVLSTGDKNTEIALSQFSEKGVFTKELDSALLDKQIDIAVHSMKDLPTVLPEGIRIAAVLEREDPRDALVMSKANDAKGMSRIEDLKEDAVVGTSSLRRRALIRKVCPHLRLDDVRGNVDTRLAKLDRGDYDALVLAAAGLKRLGLRDRISSYLDPPEFSWAVCQGAVVVVCRSKDSRVFDLVSKLNHHQTFLRCLAERALLRTLEGGCKVPIATFSEISDDLKTLKLYGCVLSTLGDKIIQSEKRLEETTEITPEKADLLGVELAKLLLSLGANEILEEIRKNLKEQ